MRSFAFEPDPLSGFEINQEKLHIVFAGSSHQQRRIPGRGRQVKAPIPTIEERAAAGKRGCSHTGLP
jgi:hypothetical protein